MWSRLDEKHEDGWLQCEADSMRNTRTGGFSVKSHTYRYIPQSGSSNVERHMDEIVGVL